MANRIEREKKHGPSGNSLYINRWRIIGGGTSARDVKRTLDYAGQGRLRTIIDEVMPLTPLHDAFELICTGTVKGKIVVDPSMG